MLSHHLKVFYGFFILLLLSGCVSLLQPTINTDVIKLRAGQYKLDKAHASLLFKVQHLQLSTYVGRFNEFDASLDFDPTNLADTKLNGVINIASLDINNPALVYDLLTSTWFHESKFPQAVFTTRSVTPINGQKFVFVGDLTWRGVTKEVSLDVTFNGGANNLISGKYTLGFAAYGSILRSDFGMDAYIPLVGDQVDIEIYAEFQRN